MPDQDCCFGPWLLLFFRVSLRTIRHAVDFAVRFEAFFQCSMSIYPPYRSLSFPLLFFPYLPVGYSHLALLDCRWPRSPAR
jgi:hypothetical protein